MPPAPTSAQTRGALAVGVCYLLWGIVPIYWKQLVGIQPLELIAHRQIWSLVFIAVLVVAQGAFGEVWAVLRQPRALAFNILCSVLLTLNWLVYVEGVAAGHVIECSLGYFLVPLVNVAAGRLVFKEQLRPLQWIAIACATGGVAWMLLQLDRPPWIAFSLTLTWGAYSLLKKKSTLGPLTGMTVETLVAAPLAIAYLLWRHHEGTGALGHVDAWTQTLILSAGIITAIPLLLFAYGAQRIRLSTLGLIQYITPTMQFILAVWLYHEPFSRDRAVSFAFIWVGLALYTGDSLLAQRNRAAV